MSEKISILMGIYNCAATLAEAIDSILAQTYTNWQLILCDDCSTDETYTIAEQYKKKCPEKIVLIKNDCNSKLAFTLNHCLRYADGEFIARMDGDDISMPNRLEIQRKYLIDHPEYDLVGCAMQRFSESGGLADILYSVDNPNYYTLRKRVPFHHATILARRKVFDKLNGYTVLKRTERGQDYDLWFRFFANGFTGNNLREPLYMVREDANAIRRRTFKTRFYALQTTWYGYSLLKYPKTWLIRPVVDTFVKALTPYKVVELYRAWQKKHK